jgi:hypothetical protein
MGLTLLTQRYAKLIAGQLSCYDRILICGTLPNICYARGMEGYLHAHKIRIYDYPRFAEPFAVQIRHNAERLAADNGIQIEFIGKKNFRQEDRVQQILRKRGEHPGLVCIFSAIQGCDTYRPRHSRNDGKNYLKPDQGKCLHYYFYFIDEELGLCYVRVPTWLPCRLQIYFNGHNWLAAQLRKRHIPYRLLDNAFAEIGDWAAAQRLADGWKAQRIHRRLEQFAQRFCPIFRHFGTRYRWSLSECEYSTDIVFRRQADLAPIYGNLTRTAIHTVKPENIATFLGKKLTGNFQDEIGNRFNVRIEGTRIRHTMGPVSLKLYDKFGLILRIEVTVNQVSFFKHYRRVEHRDGTHETKWARMKKTIYSLPALREVARAANRRYMEFLSAIEDPRAGVEQVNRLSQPVRENDHCYSGFNLFDPSHQALFEVLARGEFNISGFQNKALRKYLTARSSNQVSRLLKRLHLHGLIKKIAGTYKYYLTVMGKQVICTALKLKELYVIPQLALAPAT